MLSKEAQSYIEKRGWAKADYEALGVASEGNLVMFPLIAYTGEIVGSVGRSVVAKQFVIKLTTAKFGYFLWRGLDPERVLFLVEGIFDVG